MNREKQLTDNSAERLIRLGVQFTPSKLVKCVALYYDTPSHYITELCAPNFVAQRGGTKLGAMGGWPHGPPKGSRSLGIRGRLNPCSVHRASSTRYLAWAWPLRSFASLATTTVSVFR